MKKQTQTMNTVTIPYQDCESWVVQYHCELLMQTKLVLLTLSDDYLH